MLLNISADLKMTSKSRSLLFNKPIFYSDNTFRVILLQISRKVENIYCSFINMQRIIMSLFGISYVINKEKALSLTFTQKTFHDVQIHSQ